MMKESTERLKDLLSKSLREDLHVLEEYNFGKGCEPVDVDTLVKKIRYNGSNDIAYLLRGFEGVHYLEIVRDVAKKMHVKWSIADDEEIIEQKIIIKVLENIWNKISEDEKEQLKKLFEEQGFKNMDFSAGFPAVAIVALIAGRGLGYRIVAMVANAVAQLLLKRGIVFGAEAIAERGAGVLFGPGGMAITCILLIIDIAGPAYRKTIPSVLHIAYLRQKQKKEQFEGDCLT